MSGQIQMKRENMLVLALINDYKMEKPSFHLDIIFYLLLYMDYAIEPEARAIIVGIYCKSIKNNV